MLTTEQKMIAVTSDIPNSEIVEERDLSKGIQVVLSKDTQKLEDNDDRALTTYRLTTFIDDERRTQIVVGSEWVDA